MASSFDAYLSKFQDPRAAAFISGIYRAAANSIAREEAALRGGSGDQGRITVQPDTTEIPSAATSMKTSAKLFWGGLGAAAVLGTLVGIDPIWSATQIQIFSDQLTTARLMSPKVDALMTPVLGPVEGKAIDAASARLVENAASVAHDRTDGASREEQMAAAATWLDRMYAMDKSDGGFGDIVDEQLKESGFDFSTGSPTVMDIAEAAAVIYHGAAQDGRGFGIQRD